MINIYLKFFLHSPLETLNHKSNQSYFVLIQLEIRARGNTFLGLLVLKFEGSRKFPVGFWGQRDIYTKITMVFTFFSLLTVHLYQQINDKSCNLQLDTKNPIISSIYVLSKKQRCTLKFWKLHATQKKACSLSSCFVQSWISVWRNKP